MRALLISLPLLAFGAATSAAQEVEWTMASGYADSNFHTENLRHFIEQVEQGTDGQLAIELHSNQSLYKLPEIKRATQTGQVQAGELLLVQFGNEDPFFEVSAIPMLADTYEEAGQLWKLTEPVIGERLAEQGLKLLYGVPWPVQGFYSKIPINSSADVEGLKFRAYSAVTARMAEELGMVPATIASSEIPQAFATGLVSVMYTSPQTGIDSQAWDFTQHFMNVGGNFSMNVVVVNQDTFDDLSPDAQNAVLEAADQAEQRGWNLSEEVTAEQIGVLEEHGLTVSEPSPEFLAELKEVGETLTEEWVGKAGPEGEEIVQKLTQ
jgi:TRAP-type C4-dicarboxylate transport system substrate-binding protein